MLCYLISLCTWRISLWPNCGFWSIVAFYLLSHACDCGFSVALSGPAGEVVQKLNDVTDVTTNCML